MLLNGWLENTHAESGWINIIQQTILDSNSSNMLKVPWKNYFTTKKHLQSGGCTTWGYTRIGAKQWKNSNITLSIVSSEVHSRFTCGPHSAHDPRIHRGKPIHSQDRGLVFKDCKCETMQFLLCFCCLFGEAWFWATIDAFICPYLSPFIAGGQRLPIVLHSAVCSEALCSGPGTLKPRGVESSIGVPIRTNSGYNYNTMQICIILYAVWRCDWIPKAPWRRYPVDNRSS